MKRVLYAVAIVKQDYEVGNIGPGRRSVFIGNLETQTLVLHIANDARVLLGHAGEFGFPTAVQNDIVDVAFVRSCCLQCFGR